MKTRTKLLAALLSTVTALSCAITAAAAPAITLQGNEAKPATAEADGTATATLTLKATQFDGVGGADLTLTLAEGITLASATVKDTATTNVWTLDSGNYKVTGNTVKMVDVFNIGDAPAKETLELTLTFNVTGATVGDYNVTIDAKLADTNATLIEGVTKINGTLVIGRAKAKYNASELAANIGAGEFVPAYGAYTGDENSPTYLTKKEDGSIDVEGISGEVNVLKCKLPVGNNVTTFGASKSTVNDERADKAIQFGSYVNSIASGNTFGTLLIVGDFDGIVSYYKSKGTYDTVEKVLGRLMELLVNAETPDGTLRKVTYNNKANHIYVAKMAQTRYMWRNSETNPTQLQYALRVYNITDNQQLYTAVGYSYADTNYKFSTEIKTATLKNVGLN